MPCLCRRPGIDSKLIVRLEGLTWDEAGDIRDTDGEIVRWVWKTGSWETALDQIRAECEDDAALAGASYEPQRNPDRPLRLSDVLLRKNIMVFEPLWTLIPSNKAILPVLWSLFPNHPRLLNSTFELTEELQASGYVVKPIVGRCGANIALFDKNDNLLESTSGDFAHQDMICQQLFALPKVGHYHTQVCTFTAAGVYAGSCVRVDKSLVISQNSDCMPLRWMRDKSFLAIAVEG
jgi:glutathionylspermidine amidase/synthetase